MSLNVFEWPLSYFSLWFFRSLCRVSSRVNDLYDCIIWQLPSTVSSKEKGQRHGEIMVKSLHRHSVVMATRRHHLSQVIHLLFFTGARVRRLQLLLKPRRRRVGRSHATLPANKNNSKVLDLSNGFLGVFEVKARRRRCEGSKRRRFALCEALFLFRGERGLAVCSLQGLSFPFFFLPSKGRLFVPCEALVFVTFSFLFHVAFIFDGEY